MPNKPIADWTLGEAQEMCESCTEECKQQNGEPCIFARDKYRCKLSGDDYTPIGWDLTEQPRFDADELAFMRMLYKGGARWLARDEQDGCLMWYECKPKKLHDEWSEYRNQNGAIPTELFQQIQWSDAEPVEIAKYIEKGGDE